MLIKEISAKSAISPSHLSGFDYALNPYTGCEHGCIYCYAPYILRYKKDWGTCVEAKVNLPRILSWELRKKKAGTIGIGTVTDPYQPAERKYEITRNCLQVLAGHDFPVCIQTKSALAVRDIDVVGVLKNVEVGYTITSINDKFVRTFEPNASSVSERLDALSKLKECGIKTWVFIGPIMPFAIDKDTRNKHHYEEYEELIRRLASAGVDYILTDKFRIKPGLDVRMEEFLAARCPEHLPVFGEMLCSDNYYKKVVLRIKESCKQYGLRYKI